MLKSHMDAVEASLLSISRIPANAGHPLHKGTPREAFISEFLSTHLSERIAVGTGEVIDCDSRPGQARNQIDIVIYKRDYPRLDLGGGVRCFLAEAVVATIEVKSVLDYDGTKQAVQTASRLKALKRNNVTVFTSGYQPPGILSYLVAYDGPASMDTVHRRVSQAQEELGITISRLGPTASERVGTAAPSLDGIFVLGRGFVQYDNSPVGFITDDARAKHPDLRWAVADTLTGNLLLLFVLLTQAASGVSGSWLNPTPYLSSFSISGLRYGC